MIVESEKAPLLFKYFEEINKIPRESGHEEAIAKYIEAFARERGLFVERDGADNVYAVVPATAGREQEEPVALQGHVDMVCVKNPDVGHDFAKDPIPMYVEDGFLKARGTTLGADDGVAVALMLAIMDGALDSHPTVECIFTTDEEMGMSGADAFDLGKVKAKRLINMDSEEEDIVTAGCAGGLRQEFLLEATPAAASGKGLRISLSGLCGGHSGEDINRGRANANKLLGRLLLTLSREKKYRLVTFEGGSKDNAIPISAQAVILPDESITEKDIRAIADGLCADLAVEDGGALFTVAETAVTKAYSEDVTARFVSLITLCDCGVLAMCHDTPDMVDFSTNLGIVRTTEKKICLSFLTRSGHASNLAFARERFEALGALVGARVRNHSGYSAWEYRRDSSLRTCYMETYRALYGKEMKVAVIHAGLECGLFSRRRPDMDMISVGPNTIGIHAPGEMLDIASAERFYEIIKSVLAQKM